MAQSVRREAHRGPLGRAQVRPASHRDGRQGGGGGRADTEHDAEGRDALAGPEHGREDRRVAHDGAPNLVGVQPEAAPERDVQVSTDALFVDKEQDIVGPCMAPPDRAVVLRVDEKLQ
ncbi:MAG: hypothetical protein OXH76_21590 [Boseongicola sp.]|nr:hypothetical protein [Boseongicola sp.]